MSIRFVCLANSYKEGGRCIAGIQLDESNSPQIENGFPKWVRPICTTTYGEIPNEIAHPFELLDIIEIHNTQPKPESFQSENTLFDVQSISKIGEFDQSQLIELCENREYIFKNPFSALIEEVIQGLDHSLMVVKPEKWEVVGKSIENKAKPQQRMVFSYNGYEYDFPITDPVFLKKIQTNPTSLNQKNEAVLCLSVGVKFPATNRYYKLVAGIIMIHSQNENTM
jgi:hypothetical protein